MAINFVSPETLESLRSFNSRQQNALEQLNQPMPQPMSQPMPQPMSQPQGLLGRIGAGIKRSVQDPDFMDRLTIGLGGMTMRPNEALMGLAQNRIEQRQKLGMANEQKNRTIEALKRLNTPEAMRALQLLDAGGSISDALTMGFEKSKSDIEYKVVDGRLVKIDTLNNTVTEAFSPNKPNTYSNEQVGAMNQLRDDLRMDIQHFTQMKQGWENIETFYTNPGGVSDYALAVGFAKILDPGTAAREGEVKAVANSGAISGALKSQLINAINGQGKLPELLRAEIADLSRKMYIKKIPQAQTVLENYKRIASKVGLQLEDIYSGQPISMPSELNIIRNGAIPMPSNWPKGQAEWDRLTDEEKKEFTGE